MLYLGDVSRSFQKRLVLFAALGAVIGPCAELIHWRAGVWVLHGSAPGFWWIPGVYFLALIGAGLLFHRIEKLSGPCPPRTRGGLIAEVVALTALFLAPPVLHTHEIVLAFLAMSYLATRLTLHRARGDLLTAVLVACIDLFIEAVLVRAGMFRYTHTMFCPLPVWLALLWGGLGLGLRRLFDTALHSDRSAGPPQDV